MNILITGINGFLGSAFAEELFNDHNVYGIIRNSSSIWRLDEFKSKLNLIETPNIFEVNFSSILKNIDVVINCAVNYGKNNEPLHEIYIANLIYPLKILDACKINKVKMFINIDTFYSDKYKHLNYYTQSKKHFKLIAKSLSNEFLIINLCANHLLGPKDHNDKFIPSIILKLISNEKKIDLTKGMQIRNFTSTKMISSYTKSLLTKYKNTDKGFIDTEAPFYQCSIKSLVYLLKKIMSNNESQLNFGALKYRKNEFSNSKAIKRVKASKLKMKNFETDLTETINWYKENEKN